VGVQQVDPVQAEAFPAALGRLAYDLRRQSFRVVGVSGAGGQRAGAELGREDDLVAGSPAAPPPSEQSSLCPPWLPSVQKA
jgi:hypothetical protein